MKGPHRSPAIRRAVEQARRVGYRVEFCDFVESAATPGMLGAIGGLCDRERRLIRVRVNGMSRAQIAAIIEHELEHAGGAEHATDRPELGLRCGGMWRGPFGEVAAVLVPLDPADGAKRNFSEVTEYSEPVELEVVGGPKFSMSMSSHTYTQHERFCAPCGRWVLCKGILGAIVRPCCGGSW